MYLEFDWMCGVYRPRFHNVFTSVNGWASFPSLEAARYELSLVRLALGKKTDSRTWAIVDKAGAR